MKQPNEKFLEFQDPAEEVEVLSLKIPTWLFFDLCKIQGAWGVLLETLVLDQLEAFVISNWDLQNDQPRVEAWNE